MRNWKLTFFAAAFVVLIIGLLAGTLAVPPVDIDADITEADYQPSDLPATRPFRMGFTYQPYDWNNAAFAETARLIGKNGDFIAIFEDTGIPWPEAFNGEPYHPNVEQKLKRSKAAIWPHQTVAVMASALGIDRLSLAAYAGEADPMDRPGEWAGRHFDSPEVVTAYLAYANDLIGRFKPDYFCYLAEANASHTDAKSPAFQSMRRFAKSVYEALKSTRPDIKICIEFILSNTDHMTERMEVTSQLLPYTDVFAVSTYPFHDDAIAGDGRRLPDDWFSKVRDYAGGKPFAVLETTFAAENFMHPTKGIRVQGQHKRLLIPGGPKSQAVYINRLLKDANLLEAEFVNLWAVRDLDRLAATIGQPDSVFADPFWLLPQDSGLFDENGNPRLALQVWQKWFGLPKR